MGTVLTIAVVAASGQHGNTEVGMIQSVQTVPPHVACLRYFFLQLNCEWMSTGPSKES